MVSRRDQTMGDYWEVRWVEHLVEKLDEMKDDMWAKSKGLHLAHWTELKMAHQMVSLLVRLWVDWKDCHLETGRVQR
jgi:hypothetical protein